MIRSKLIHHLLEQRADEIRVAYYYFDYSHADAQTFEEIVRCLLKQVLSQTALVPSGLEGLHDNSIAGKTRPSTSSLMKILLEAIENHPGSMFLFDALDESSQRTWPEFADFLVKLASVRAKVLCAGRLNTEEVRACLLAPAILSVSAVKEDVSRYLSERLSKVWQYTDWLKSQIRNHLEAKAEGRLPFTNICF